jgi:hypothetical protein
MKTKKTIKVFLTSEELMVFVKRHYSDQLPVCSKPIDWGPVYDKETNKPGIAFEFELP